MFSFFNSVDEEEPKQRFAVWWSVRALCGEFFIFPRSHALRGNEYARIILSFHFERFSGDYGDYIHRDSRSSDLGNDRSVFISSFPRSAW